MKRSSSIRQCLWALTALGCFLALVLTFWTVPGRLEEKHAGPVGPSALQETMTRGEAVIVAIRAYTHDHGRPPTQLADLIPQYLPRIPSAGRLAADGWHYDLSTAPPGAGGWSLWVIVRGEYALPPWSFGDVLAYHPSGHYPTKAYGGVVEPLGLWAYYGKLAAFRVRCCRG